MQTVRAPRMWRHVDSLEQAMCVRINLASRHALVRRFFTVVSRLGDGALWYALMFAFALSSQQGMAVAAQMAVAALANLALYKTLKHRLVRERPYVSHAGIELGTAPLDRYSFPSGHTLHACGFTTIAVCHVPELAVVLVPFAVLVAVSRVVLGLHYPTDVIAGALLGSGVAAATLELIPL